jgi:AraC-like DNA-binding protein
MMYATNNACLMNGVWNLLEFYGIDPEPLFREMAMNPELMRQSGGRYRLENFSALGYAMLASNCLRTALERVVRYHRVLTDEQPLKLDETEAGLTVSLVFSHDIPERDDAVLAVLMRMCRLNYIDDLAPVSVTLTRPKPSCSARYFEYYRSPVVFDAPTNSLTLPLVAVDKNLPGSNPQLAELNDQVMIEYLAELDQDNIIHKVKAVIIDQLPSGKITDEGVARELHMSSRKLQRQLQSTGTTFSTLLNEMRQDLAQQYLREQDISMTEIAFLLGFSESSAFSRAFKRWIGVSPSEYRKVA